MQYATLGATDLRVSEVGLGTWSFNSSVYGPVAEDEAQRAIAAAREMGIKFFDTAPLYGQGRSEKVLGHALKGVTEPYYLATKVGYHPSPYDYTRDTVWRGFEASLQRLQRADHLRVCHERWIRRVLLPQVLYQL